MTTATKKTVKTNKKEQMTPFQKENLETIKKIQEYKTACEANVVSIMWKNPELIRQANLSLNDFSINIWRVYFTILYDIIINEGKNVIDEVICGMYLSKHKKLEKVFADAGGYQTVVDAGTYVKEEAFDGYLQELRKWNAMLKLAKRGYIDRSRMSEYVDMSAEDIYDELQVYINDTFANVDQKIKSYDISDGIYELIDRMDEGYGVGLEYYNMPMISAETGGQMEGNITLVGGLSNVGKSSWARSSTLPTIIKHNEQVVIYLNEENQQRWQRELLISVCNNVLKYDIQKHVLRNGHFSQEVKDHLIEAAKWIEDNTKNHNITIIPFEKYNTDTVIKLIKKYASMGVKYFVLDTFKLDAGKVNTNSWLELQQNMVAINDAIKPAACNVHILITFQLAKGSVSQRFYTQDNIGVSKNIVDPVSTCIMIRDLFPDEMPGEKHELKIYKMGGQNGKSKIPVKLDPEKFYQVVFVIKNREGAHNKQYIIEHDLSRNTLKEVGFCTVPPDLW